ncbi:uncharacterized protein LOC142334283 isoform X2 [Lycorma delicatula]|uniref:uncharacterized protein LOC142334283 isoform X2 n=1 Tax=Lycorma delicatula TaxID=130591 RepID=UPI003F51078A
MSSDAAAARREARRRRILENSDKRLTKIISCDNSRGDDLVSSLSSVSNEQIQCNGTVSSAIDEELQPQGSFFPHEEVNVSESVLPNKCEESVSQLLFEETLVDADVEDKTTVIFWIDCLFIIFLSITVRLMYQFNMSSMFAESLFVPFATISVAKFAANPSKHISKSIQCFGMIRASLLLSGVPKKWLDKIFLVAQMFVDIGNDFALYLFSFTVTHIFLESFVNR